MGNSVNTEAIPVVDARRLTERVFSGDARHLLEWASAAGQSRRSQTRPRASDLFAVRTGRHIMRELTPMPAFSHHLMSLRRGNAVARGEGNIGGFRGQVKYIPKTPVGHLIPAGCPSALRTIEGVAQSIDLFLSPSILSTVATETLGIDPALDPVHPIVLLEDGFLNQVGDVVAGLVASSDLGGLLYLESLAHTTAMHLLAHYVDFPVTPRPVKGRLPVTVLRQIADYVEEQPDSQLTLAKLASLAHLSPYHFARLFKNTTGQTVHAFVLAQRLLRACDLLLATRLPIGHIAMETGFADESHFVRSFKFQFGVTPGVVRRSALQ